MKGPYGSRGRGSQFLGTTVLAQLALAAQVWMLPPPPALVPPPLGLAAVGVVELADGSPPQALSASGSYVEGARLQVTVETDRDAWVSVLWFEGPDRVVSLYPAVGAGESGFVAGGTTYAVPSAGSYLRLTPTGPDGDLLAVIASDAPDPRIEAVLLNPTRAAVAALRAELVDHARSRTSIDGKTQRFLPTADGRAVAVPWEQVRGHGRIVQTRWVQVTPRGHAG
jgi:hypothetical protein